MSLLATLGEERVTKVLSALPGPEAKAFLNRLTWRRKQARPNQLPPPRDGLWRVWLLQGGRGSGKTRPAAEWLWYEAWTDPGSISHVVARRDIDHKTTTFGGPSGLLSCIPYELIAKKTEGPWAITLKHPSSVDPNAGSKILGFTASEPGTLRGPQSMRTWCDEMAGWEKLEDAWAQVQLSTRLPSPRNKTARIVISTTPKPKPIIAQLNKRYELESKRIAKGELTELQRTVVISRYSTFENAANLDENTLGEYQRIYGKTKLGRQELYAELIDPSEAGIVKRSDLKLWPAYSDADRTVRNELPDFDLVILSLDTAYEETDLDKETGDPDPTACQVWGVFTVLKKDKPPVVNAMLLFAWAETLGFPELVRRTKEEMKHRYGRVRQPIIKPLFGPSFLDDSSAKPPDLILIENKVSGISLRQVLAAEGLPVIPYNPGRASKLLRLHTVSHLFPAGRVWLPESEVDERAGQPVDWAEPVIDQLTTFAGEGTITNDDHVDAAAQLLRYVYDKEIGTITMADERLKVDEDEADRVIRPIGNPYAA